MIFFIIILFHSFVYRVVLILTSSPSSSSPSVDHPPSKARAAPPMFLPHLVPHELLVVGKKKIIINSNSNSSPRPLSPLTPSHHQLCAVWLRQKHPLTSFSAQRRETNGNKNLFLPSFSGLFWVFVPTTPYCLEKVVCERLTSPRPLPPTTYTFSSPFLSVNPFLSLHSESASLHIHVCLNADGIKRLLLPQSISVFLFYLLLQVEGICGMLRPRLTAVSTSPLRPNRHPFCFCMDMIGIHILYCCLSTHKSQANSPSTLPPPGFGYVSVCMLGAAAAAAGPSPTDVTRSIPRRLLLCVLLRLPKQPVLSALRLVLVSSV